MEIMNNVNENKTDYNEVINYLLKNINSKEIKEDINLIDESKPVFLYEFFVFELYIPIELLKTIKQPLLAFRLLEFPTQTIEGKIDMNKESILFNQGKSCFFEIEIHQLKQYLQNEPLYIMFIDMNFGDMKIIGSSRVNISIFAFDQFLQYTGSKPPQPRRNILKLFDSASAKVAEFDLTLLIRREYFKYDSKMNLNVNEMLQNKNKQIYIVDPFKNCQIKQQTNDELFNNNQLYIIPKDNRGPPKDQIMKELNVIKKEAGVNTIEEYKRQENFIKQVEDLNVSPPNQNQDYVKSLKNLLEGKEKNPPPLFFHNQRRRESYNQIATLHENQGGNKQINGSSHKENLVDTSVQVNNGPNIQNIHCKTFSNNNKQNIKMSELDRIKENVKIREKMNKTETEYIKRVPSKPIYSNINIKDNSNLNPSENYAKKMRQVERYNSSKNSNKKDNNISGNGDKNNNKSKSFIEEENDDLQNNEYYNLFNKIKPKNKESNKKVDLSYNNNNTMRSITDQSAHSSNKSNKNIKIIEKDLAEDNCNSKLYEKFYEISNTHQFEISCNVKASQNEMLRSYNSLSVSNSIPYEILSGEKQSNTNINKKLQKSVKFEKNEVIRSIDSASKKENMSATDVIEEELNQSSIYNYLNNTNKSNSGRKKATTEDDIIEEYNDFDYDHVEESDHKFNNKVLSSAKEESIIEEDIS